MGILATFHSVSRSKSRVISKIKSLISVFLTFISPNLSAFVCDLALCA